MEHHNIRAWADTDTNNAQKIVVAYNSVLPMMTAMAQEQDSA